MNELLPRRKKKSVRLGFILWSGLFFILGVGLVGAAYFVLYSDFFKVKNFDVRGANLISKEKVISSLYTQAVGSSKISSFLGPDNILFWKFGKAADIAPEALPTLIGVSIKTKFGDRSVIVEAVDRQAIGVWCVQDESCYVFDEEGIIFGQAPEVQGTLILKIIDENDRNIVLGEQFFNKPEWVGIFFETINVIRKQNLAIASIVIKDLNLREWQVQTEAGPVFLFGLDFLPENFEGIVKNLDSRFEFNKVTYFDFRVQNRIYYK